VNPIWTKIIVDAVAAAMKECPICKKKGAYPRKQAGHFYTCKRCGHRFKEKGCDQTMLLLVTDRLADILDRIAHFAAGGSKGFLDVSFGLVILRLFDKVRIIGSASYLFFD
jgi:ribosomal protein L37AE/L43A